MNVIYEGTDVLFVHNPENILTVIACNKEAENSLYDWQIKYMNRTGEEIGTLRTVFGLTFYAREEQEQKALRDFISEKNFKTYHGHI